MNPQTFGIEQVKTEMAQGLAACDTFHGFRYFAGSKYLSRVFVAYRKAEITNKGGQKQ